MAPDKLSRDPGQSGDEPTEGVRIIAAEELEEVAERGEVAQRRSPGEPGYKDRPAPPPDDVSPAIRFPLPDSADPSDIVRPKPAPVVAPRAAGSVPDRPEAPPVADDDTTSVSLGEEAEPATPSGPLGSLDEPVPFADPQPGDPARPPAETSAPPQFDDRGPAATEAPPMGADAPPPPVLDLGPSTGEHQLPHWTEPPTGEVPRVVIGEGEGADDEDRWANYATGGGSGPRWRDERDSGQHDDLVGDLLAVSGGDDEPVVERLGALDQTERVTDDAYLNFDDVELDPRQRGRRGGRRGRGARSRQAPPATDPLAAIVADAPPKASTTGPVPIAPAAPAPAGRPRLSAPPPPPDQDPAAPRQRRRPPEPPAPTEGGGGRNVPQAIAVGVALAVVALLVFKAGPAPAMVLVEIVVVLAGFEYYGAVLRGGFRPATLLGLTAVAALPLAAYWKGEAAFPMILFLTFVVGVLWYLLGIGGKVRPTANLGVTMVGVVWVGVMGAFAALILDIPTGQGVSILVVAIVAAVAHDAGGFFIGRSMGRTPLSDISPNKTVEGLVGGVLSALVAVFVVAVLFGVGPFSSGQALVFGLFTALIAPLGDLAESLFKRDLGLKDMGSILPQHGGILDRFDGMLFVLPTAYYVCRVLGLT
jgi:phosphatidate cytidylyltransferase